MLFFIFIFDFFLLKTENAVQAKTIFLEKTITIPKTIKKNVSFFFTITKTLRNVSVEITKKTKTKTVNAFIEHTFQGGVLSTTKKSILFKTSTRLFTKKQYATIFYTTTQINTQTSMETITLYPFTTETTETGETTVSVYSYRRIEEIETTTYYESTKTNTTTVLRSKENTKTITTYEQTGTKTIYYTLIEEAYEDLGTDFLL